MARPKLARHQLGKISYVTVVSKEDATKDRPPKVLAKARFCDSDDRVRLLERSGRSQAAAKKALEDHAATRRRGGTLESTHTVADAAGAYLASVAGDIVDTTMDRYRSRWGNHIEPALGTVQLKDVTPADVQQFMDGLRDAGLGRETRRGILSLTRAILDHARRAGAIDNNPAADTRQVRGGERKAPAEAFTEDELLDFLIKMDAALLPDGKGGRPPDPITGVIIRFLFGTGVRYGEALAVRWQELNLTDEPKRCEGRRIPARSVAITGNLVHVTGKGVVRHEGKTFKSQGIVPLPGFLVTLLTVLRPPEAEESEPIFPGWHLGWKHPACVQRSVRRLRERAGYPNFTTHRGRKTVATVLESKGHTARQVADLLRHSNVSTTQNAYFGRGQVNTRAAEDLDAMHRR